MTLKLVENVVPLNTTNYGDIAAMSRGFADLIDAGTLTPTSAMLIVIDEYGGVAIDQWGECLNRAEGIGVLTMATAQFLSDD